MRLAGAVVIVTGASHGLGRAMALALASRGAKVVAAARFAADPGPGAMDALVAAVEERGGHGLAVRTDVRDPGAAPAMVQAALDRFGHVDALVNDAGVLGPEAGVEAIEPELWREILETNLTGAFHCSRAVLPHLGAGAAIVNVSSGAAVRCGFLNLAYGVSKAGLDRLTLGLAGELRGRGIACVSLSPPVSDTGPVRRLYPDRDPGAWAAPPRHSAEALCRLLAGDPLAHSGRVVTVRELLSTAEE